MPCWLVVVLVGAVLWGGASEALTGAQLTTLKNDIAADGSLNTVPHTSDTAVQVADAYNVPAAVDCWVWKTKIPPEEYTGSAGVVWTEVDALTVGKARIFEWLTGLLTKPINAADPNVQQGMKDAFGTGACSTAAPSTMQVEGLLHGSEVEQAWAQ